MRTAVTRISSALVGSGRQLQMPAGVGAAGAAPQVIWLRQVVRGVSKYTASSCWVGDCSRREPPRRCHSRRRRHRRLDHVELALDLQKWRWSGPLLASSPLPVMMRRRGGGWSGIGMHRVPHQLGCGGWCWASNVWAHPGLNRRTRPMGPAQRPRRQSASTASGPAMPHRADRLVETVFVSGNTRRPSWACALQRRSSPPTSAYRLTKRAVLAPLNPAMSCHTGPGRRSGPAPIPTVGMVSLPVI